MCVCIYIYRYTYYTHDIYSQSQIPNVLCMLQFRI